MAKKKEHRGKKLTKTEIKDIVTKMYSTKSDERKNVVEKFLPIIEDRVIQHCLASHLLYPVVLKQGMIPSVQNEAKYKVKEIWESGDYNTLKTIKKDPVMYNNENHTGTVAEHIFFNEFVAESVLSITLNEFETKSSAPIDRIFEKTPYQIAAKLNTMFSNCLAAIVAEKEPGPEPPGYVKKFFRKRGVSTDILDTPKLTVVAMKQKALTIQGASILLVSKDVYAQYKSVIIAYIEDTEMGLKIAPGLGNDFIYFLPSPKHLGYFATRVTTQVYSTSNFHTITKYAWTFLRIQSMIIFSRDVAGIRV